MDRVVEWAVEEMASRLLSILISKISSFDSSEKRLLEDVVNEARTFSSLCVLVDQHLNQIYQMTSELENKTKISEDQKETLRDAMRNQMQAIEETSLCLEKAAESKSFGVKEVEQARNRIRLHTSGQQIVLLAINTKVCCLAPWMREDDETESQSTSPSTLSTVDDEVDDLNSTIIERTIETAMESYEANDFAKAAGYLREALKFTKEMSAAQKNGNNTWHLRLLLGICAFRISDPGRAQAILQAVFDRYRDIPKPSKDEIMILCEASHVLAQLHIQRGSLEKSAYYALFSLRRQRQMSGEDNFGTVVSFALMARIEQLLGNETRSIMFLRMIPAARRLEFQAMFADLSPQQSTPPDPTSNTAKGTPAVYAESIEYQSDDEGVDSGPAPSSGMESLPQNFSVPMNSSVIVPTASQNTAIYSANFPFDVNGNKSADPFQACAEALARQEVEQWRASIASDDNGSPVL